MTQSSLAEGMADGTADDGTEHEQHEFHACTVAAVNAEWKIRSGRSPQRRLGMPPL
ncbi:hypothetical protein [Dactylosporangium sp. NPDC048998]|uniref:hypothetical protein n=1 Tax=Dactylosporangium sp. NPDC048998 TaxID=3363976 RepID=UPI0037214156